MARIKLRAFRQNARVQRGRTTERKLKNDSARPSLQPIVTLLSADGPKMSHCRCTDNDRFHNTAHRRVLLAKWDTRGPIERLQICMGSCPDLDLRYAHKQHLETNHVRQSQSTIVQVWSNLRQEFQFYGKVQKVVEENVDASNHPDSHRRSNLRAYAKGRTIHLLSGSHRLHRMLK